MSMRVIRTAKNTDVEKLNAVGKMSSKSLSVPAKSAATAAKERGFSSIWPPPPPPLSLFPHFAPGSYLAPLHVYCVLYREGSSTSIRPPSSPYLLFIVVPLPPLWARKRGDKGRLAAAAVEGRGKGKESFLY